MMAKKREPDLDALINSLNETVVLISRNCSVLFINRAGEEFFAKSCQEIIGRKLKDLLPEAVEITRQARKAMREIRSFSAKDVEVKTSGNSNMDFDIYPYIIGDRCEGALLSMSKNVSIAEREDSSFDSLIYLLGSIAHEIKNPLGGIKGAAQLLKKRLSDNAADKGLAEYINLVIRETDRLNSVLQGYLTISKKPFLHPLNIHEIIEKSVSIMKIFLQDGKISLRRFYDPSLPKVIGDEGKLLQVFLNIIKNAIEAMPRGGNLSITTRPSVEHVIQKGRTKRWAVVSVADTGKGISKNELQKIFLPFYTNKKKGTGLGLALSKKIIRDHNGFIRVEKAPAGKGTVFNVYIPFAD